MALDINGLLQYGLAQRGKPYVWAATGPDAFDCSGLVQFMFHHFGVDVPRTSQQQARAGQPVDRGKIQPGDLIFFDWGDGPNSHVGVYMGNNQLLNAPQSGDVVRVADMSGSHWSHVTAIRRMTDTSGSWVDGAVGAVGGAAGDAVSSIVGPLVQPLKDLATAASSGAKLADKTMQIFLPTNFVRLTSGLAGMFFIIIGILMLSRELR